MLKQTIFTTLLLCTTSYTMAADMCPLTVIEEFNELQNEENVAGRYEVYSPIGERTIQNITQTPRLDTLDNKTIAVVGESFMADVTHPEIKRLIQQHYPKAKVILQKEIGIAGPYPLPGIVREKQQQFEAKLKQMKVNAVISGNGGCGLCTPKEEGACITAEKLGIPCVLIAAPGFTEQAKATAQNAGVPIQRVATYPGAFSSHTQEELIQNTQKVLWTQIVEGLTKSFTDGEKQEAEDSFKKYDRTAIYSGDLAQINAYFEEQGWADGQPIIPPTKDKIEAFLKYTDLSADTEIGVLPIAQRKVTPFEVAVVGVMADCKPEYMPILIAITKGMADGNFRKTLSSTHAWTPYTWLNGPLARQLGFDSSQGEISTTNNKKLARFMELAMLNLAGYRVKENRMGTFGYIAPWNLVEDEKVATNIGWMPYHVQQGFKTNESTVTLSSALMWGNNLTPSMTDAQLIMEMMAWDITQKGQFALSSGNQFVNRTILITENVANNLSKTYPSKEDLEKALIHTAIEPFDERVYARYYANPGNNYDAKDISIAKLKHKLSETETPKENKTPLWLKWTKAENIQTIPVMQQGMTAFLITGDSSRNKVMTLPGGGAATVKIELPQNWDTMVQEIGYQPLNKFYLSDEKINYQIKQKNTTNQKRNPNRKKNRTRSSVSFPSL